MNFKFNRFFSLAFSFIMGGFFLLLGIFAIILPWTHKIKEKIAHFFLENTLILSLFGLGFALIGLSIILYHFLISRRQYVSIQTGKQSIAISESVVQGYLDAYWRENFPHTHVHSEIKLKKKSIQIIADLPALPLTEQKIFLEKVKDDFAHLFENILGYSYEVHLFASFKQSPSQSTPD